MKTLKITLALVAIAMLTVSGVQSDKVVAENEPTYKEVKSYDFVAHVRKKGKVQTQG
ncbi:hypothetical protein [Winogradskyella tangerina]|uniref:hypothetical protein n=1 Tax=Winogradskyella tangerina TaxID=2023240 RepID=UPI001300454A|nr:hypothetical protein [Winogradskyella tangerina]